jgi:hypothetical protein
MAVIAIKAVTLMSILFNTNAFVPTDNLHIPFPFVTEPIDF